MKKRFRLLAVGLWLAPAALLRAQDSTSAASDAAARVPAPVPAAQPWWFGFWAGAATHAPFETRHGHRNRDFYIAAIRIGRELDTSPRFAYDYFVDVIPLLRQTNIPVEYRDVSTCGENSASPQLCSSETVMLTETARGFGVTPLGLQMRVFPANRLQLVLGLSLGVVLYDSPVPDPDERRLNFMGDLTAGLQLRIGRSGQFLAGVRQNHTSNGFTGSVNPGLDARVLYLGATRSLGSRGNP